MHIACASCGADLDRPPSRIKANGHQFCDRRCHTAFQSRRVEVACGVCGARFELQPSRVTQNRSTVCSEPCRREAISRAHVERFGSATSRVAACAHCRAPITRKPSQLAKYPTNFCDRACATAHKRGKVVRTNGEWLPCEKCGRDVWRTPASRSPHTFCSRKCAGRTGDRSPTSLPVLSGPAHPMWRGGSTPYAPGFTRGLSARIRLRDGNACRLCGLAWLPRSGNLVAHHVDRRKADHDPGNLITLCRTCHNKIHAGTATLS